LREACVKYETSPHTPISAAQSPIVGILLDKKARQQAMATRSDGRIGSARARVA
jgi:hypothetical protein